MYVMYVDESGDTGVVKSPTAHFVLASLIVHELRWHAALDRLVAFRRRMKNKFGLKMSEEIHASRLINRPGPLVRISRNDRLRILHAFIEEIAALPDVNVGGIITNKRASETSDHVFDRTWTALIQRFENTRTPELSRDGELRRPRCDHLR